MDDDEGDWRDDRDTVMRGTDDTDMREAVEDEDNDVEGENDDIDIIDEDVDIMEEDIDEEDEDEEEEGEGDNDDRRSFIHCVTQTPMIGERDLCVESALVVVYEQEFENVDKRRSFSLFVSCLFLTSTASIVTVYHLNCSRISIKTTLGGKKKKEKQNKFVSEKK